MMSAHLNPTFVEEGVGALTIGANLIASPLTRSWYATWGATAAESNQPLPGDEIVSAPNLVTTRAITIRAPAAAVWPWLLQLGQGRAGLYSFQRLENLAGCRIQNVNEIRPELQNLAPGDFVRLGPEGYPYYVVQAIQPGQTIVLVTPQEGNAVAQSSWVFHLEPLDRSTSRLIHRSRLSYSPSRANWLIWRAITDPMFFVMERRMLIGIRDRAETLSLAAQADRGDA